MKFPNNLSQVLGENSLDKNEMIKFPEEKLKEFIDNLNSFLTFYISEFLFKMAFLNNNLV